MKAKKILYLRWEILLKDSVSCICIHSKWKNIQTNKFHNIKNQKIKSEVNRSKKIIRFRL